MTPVTLTATQRSPWCSIELSSACCTLNWLQWQQSGCHMCTLHTWGLLLAHAVICLRPGLLLLLPLVGMPLVHKGGLLLHLTRKQRCSLVAFIAFSGF